MRARPCLSSSSGRRPSSPSGHPSPSSLITVSCPQRPTKLSGAFDDLHLQGPLLRRIMHELQDRQHSRDCAREGHDDALRSLHSDEHDEENNGGRGHADGSVRLSIAAISFVWWHLISPFPIPLTAT